MGLKNCFSTVDSMQTNHPNTPSAASTDGEVPTHPPVFGYLFWLFGFTGAHRFYFGKPLTGILWFCTGGLFLVGWIVDLFFIKSMSAQANTRFHRGRVDQSVTWMLHVFLGLFGLHRIYMGKFFTGLLYLCTGALCGFGYVYDTLTLNTQIEELNIAA